MFDLLEKLVELEIIPKVRITIHLGVSTIVCTSTLFILAKDVNHLRDNSQLIRHASVKGEIERLKEPTLC